MIFCEYASPIPERLVNSAFDALLMSSSAVFVARAAFAADVAAEICGEDKVNRNVAPSLGGEDFSYMLQAVPGAMIWLGNGPGEGGCMLHNARYDFNDDALPVGVSFFVRLAERFLEKQS